MITAKRQVRYKPVETIADPGLRRDQKFGVGGGGGANKAKFFSQKLHGDEICPPIWRDVLLRFFSAPSGSAKINKTRITMPDRGLSKCVYFILKCTKQLIFTQIY